MYLDRPGKDRARSIMRLRRQLSTLGRDTGIRRCWISRDEQWPHAGLEKESRVVLEYQAAHAAHETDTAHHVIQILAAGSKSPYLGAIAKEMGSDKGGEKQDDNTVRFVDLLLQAVKSLKSQTLKLCGTRVPNIFIFRPTNCHVQGCDGQQLVQQKGIREADGDSGGLPNKLLIGDVGHGLVGIGTPVME
ncbi:MAG: hypothetical protein Q9180_004974 [Flavoplaca navasiana]